jgi:hypothetical protein
MGSDIISEAFLLMRNNLYDIDCNPIQFYLRPKKNTQDDPLDEYLSTNILSKLENVITKKAPGPLITPDVILFRPNATNANIHEFKYDINRIVGLEVKKIEKTAKHARISSMDFNTTPPCGTIRIYDKDKSPLDIRGFYLFLCLEKSSKDKSRVIASSLILADGNLLNDDFNFYLSIIGERKKKVGIGSYKDGINRSRPMLTFPTPLGIPELANKVTLIHPSPSLSLVQPELKIAYIIKRTKDEEENLFCCYQKISDLPIGWEPEIIINPFHIPKKRNTKTHQRGKFKLDLWMNTK